jgi:amino acid adenylation domain-containing protein
MNHSIIHQVFEEKAGQFAEHIAVKEVLREITYKDLNANANRLAHRLLQFGYTGDAMIGVLLDPGIELVQCMLATFKSGYIYLPLDINFTDRRFAEIFRITPCRTIITNRKYEPSLKALLLRLEVKVENIVLLEDEPLLMFSDINPDVPVEADAGLYIIYTSGSTGEGKAILGCHKGLSHFIHWELEEFNIGAGCRVSQLSQITFDATFRDMLMPLCTGGILCIPSPEIKSDIIRLMNWLEESEVELMHCVPSLFRLMLRELALAPKEGKRFPSLKYVLMAGESLFARDVRQWYEQVGSHAEIVNLYGTSETTLAKTFHRIKEMPPDASEAMHVGKPIKDTFIAIVNNGELCSVGEIGEIYIKTAYMTKGYYNNPLLNELSFIQNPLIHDRIDIVHKTGDFGKYLKDRSIQYYGRLDDQVKVNGIRVELNEIKLAVMDIPGIKETEMSSQKNSDQEVKLICYYTSDEIEAEELRLLLKGRISDQIMPAWFIRLPEFPLNINGKIDRKKLPQPNMLVFNQENYVAPESPTAQILERIWSEVLGLQQISENISFFKIGGNSLRAMQVISRIFHAVNIPVRINDIFLHPTIRELANVIDGLSAKPVETIRSLGVQAYYDTSHGQKRLWLLTQMNESMLAYNIYGTYTLEGHLNVALLELAFDTLYQRHESLRTTFHFIDGALLQKVAPYAKGGFPLHVTDICEEENQEEYARKWVNHAGDTIFQLSVGPLFTIGLLKLAPEKHLLVLSMHHIISDDWSLKIITKEVIALYEAYRKGEEPVLLPLLVQYKDFSAWHNQLLQSKQLQTDKAYWLQQFSGKVPVLKLPLDFPRPPSKTYAGAMLKLFLDKTFSNRLKHFAGEQEVTLFMLLLAAVNLLLYKYTGETDIVIGSPIAGRTHRSLEEQIGFYVNVLPLRVRFDEHTDFHHLLQQVRENVLAAFEHQQYPFDAIVADLQLPADRGRSPLFDVMMAVQNSFIDRASYQEMGGVTVSDVETDNHSSKFDLEFNFYEAAEDITLFIHYNTDLFTAGRIALMQERLLFLLKEILSSPHSSLRELAEQADRMLRHDQAVVTENPLNLFL